MTSSFNMLIISMVNATFLTVSHCLVFCRQVVDMFGAMTGWSDAQLVKLKEKAVATFGPTGSWDGSVLSASGVMIGKLYLRNRKLLVSL